LFRNRSITVRSFIIPVDVRPLLASDSRDNGSAFSGGQQRLCGRSERQRLTPEGCQTTDAALLAILLGGGLRRSEEAALALADWEPAERRLTVRQGKGAVGRVVYLSPSAAGYVDAWLAWLDSEGRLPRRISPGDRISAEDITPGSVAEVLHRMADRARVAGFSPHDARRTMFSNMLGAGVDVATVQRQRGHRNVGALLGYDRRNDAFQRVAALDLLA
jgi:integrase